jgi:hypothetical protein
MFYGTDNILQMIPHIQCECEEYSPKYCQSHITLLWIWIMLRRHIVLLMTYLTYMHRKISDREEKVTVKIKRGLPNSFFMYFLNTQPDYLKNIYIYEDLTPNN